MSDKIYEKVNNRILELMDKGEIPWRKSWKGGSGLAENYISKKKYQGTNFFTTNFSGYTCPYWLTYRQAAEIGGNVKKGEGGTPIVYYSSFEKEKDGKKEVIPFIKMSYVFNLEQCEGLEGWSLGNENNEKLPTCEELISRYPLGMPSIKNEEMRAFYDADKDYINMPSLISFESSEAYYGVLFHEQVHATGHKDRLNRPTLINPHRFGSPEYSKEELIAELGSSYLSALCGIDAPLVENNAAYLQNWIRKLKNEPSLFVKSAAQAQKAVNYLLQVKAT